LAVNKRKVLDAARKYVQKGAKEKALKEYERLLKLDPKDGRLRLEIGDTHRRWGQIEEAITQYSRVAEQYQQDGFDARAVAVYKQILNLDPKRMSSYVALGEIYQRMGLDAEAVNALQTAADGYHKEGKKREALELLRKMASLDPTNTGSRLKVADLLRQEGLDREAVAEYEAVAKELENQEAHEAVANVYTRILEIEPRRVEVLAALGRSLIQQGRPERAEPFAKRALELDAEEAANYELLCDVYKALDRGDELADVTRRLARLYRDRGDDQGARQIMQRLPSLESLEMNADLSEEAPVLGGDLSESESLIADEELLEDEFLVSDESAAEAADLSEEEPLAEPPPAEPQAEAAPPEPEPELEPEADEESLPEGDPEQLFAEASVYLRYGKRDQAIASLRAILGQDPAHGAALEKLGEAYAEGGDNASAVDAWTRAATCAREAGESQVYEVLRDRIASLDPEAAGALPPLAAPEAAAPAVEEDGHEFEIDVEGDEPDAALADAAADEDGGIEIDVESGDEDGDVSQPVLHDTSEIDIDVDDLDADEGAGEAAAAGEEASEAGSGGGLSTTSAQRINEDLEEAEFYFQQKMWDESQAIYERILETAPQHPSALLRLGEIAALRGEDPSAVSGDSASAEAAADEPGDETEAVEIDLDADEEEDLPGRRAEDTAPEAARADAGEESSGDDLELDLDASEDEEPAGETQVEGATAEEGAFSTPTLEHQVDEEAAPAAEEAAPQPPARDRRGEDTQPLSAEGAPAAAADSSETFDLAAELRDVFEDEEESDPAATSGVLSTVEDGFAAIFSEFKKGVTATLSEGDYDTRYDLGIAYREMGLLEDAIGEFRVCLESPERLVQSLHMMGLCALDLSRPTDAVSHFEQALATEGLPGETRAAIGFDLGRAFEAAGDLGRAKSALDAVAEIDPAFPGLHERLATLAEETSGAAAAPAGEELEALDDVSEDALPAGEAFESFDDVITEAEAEAVAADQTEDATPVPDDATPVPDDDTPVPREPQTPDADSSGSSGRRPGRRKKISFV
jgi:pilus assembly protein FimV